MFKDLCQQTKKILFGICTMFCLKILPVFHIRNCRAGKSESMWGSFVMGDAAWAGPLMDWI